MNAEFICGTAHNLILECKKTKKEPASYLGRDRKMLGGKGGKGKEKSRIGRKQR